MTTMNEKRILEATDIFEKLKKNKEYCFRKIEIIDGITVSCSLNKGSSESYYIIRSGNIFYKAVNVINLYISPNFKGELTYDLLFSMLDNLHETVSKLKFDKLLQEFRQKPNTEDFDDFMDAEECSVCFSKTKTNTNCKHPLCLVCWTLMLKKWFLFLSFMQT